MNTTLTKFHLCLNQILNQDDVVRLGNIHHYLTSKKLPRSSSLLIAISMQVLLFQGSRIGAIYLCLLLAASLSARVNAHDETLPHGDESQPRDEKSWVQFTEFLLQKGQRHFEAMNRRVALLVLFWSLSLFPSSDQYTGRWRDIGTDKGVLNVNSLPPTPDQREALSSCRRMMQITAHITQQRSFGVVTVCRLSVVPSITTSSTWLSMQVK